MAHPKHDYDSEEFYQDIYAFAMQGLNDGEIADKLNLDPDTFGAMKGGIYHVWNEEQNKERSSKIVGVLGRARRSVNGIIRGRYLKAALGGIKTKNKTTTKRKLKINGEYTDDEEVMTSETETELPPNMQALATWLYHHDPDWRKVERNQDEDNGDVPTDGSISIDKWITNSTEITND